jgi:hypothetical protein
MAFTNIMPAITAPPAHWNSRCWRRMSSDGE